MGNRALGDGSVAALRAQATALAPTYRAALVRRFLGATAQLPRIGRRTLYLDEKSGRYFTTGEAAALGPAARARMQRLEGDEALYYTTRYGTPLSYARPLQVLADAGLRLRAGSQVLDFGYGHIGHLRLLATLGARVTGVDVDPLLSALYGAPGDQGAFGPGSVRLVHGRFPADASVVAAIGSRYALILSKNVLKRGFIHPERGTPLVQLGPDDAVLSGFRAALKPGGRMLIYNISRARAPRGKPFIPSSDGRSPFSAAQWRRAGFHVRAFDRDDTQAARVMGRGLRWDQGEDGIDLTRDLFALYTLVERAA